VRKVSWVWREGWEGFSAWARDWVMGPVVRARPPCWGRGAVQAGSIRRRARDQKDQKDLKDGRDEEGFMRVWFFEIYFCSHYVWGHKTCYLVHRGEKRPQDHGPQDHF